MKKIHVLLLMFLVCFASFGFMHVLPQKPSPAKKMYVYAEETTVKEDNQIAVIGNASKTLNADTAIIVAYFESVSVEFANNKDLKFDMIKENIFEKGVEDDDLALNYFSSYPQNQDHKNFVNCYNFTVNIKDLKILNDVLIALKSYGVDIIDVKYQVSNIDEEYSQILVSAVEDAKEKACKMCNRENLEVVDIKEKNVLYSSTFCSSNFDDNQSIIQLKGIVYVVFE